MSGRRGSAHEEELGRRRSRTLHTALEGKSSRADFWLHTEDLPWKHLLTKILPLSFSSRRTKATHSSRDLS